MTATRVAAQTEAVLAALDAAVPPGILLAVSRYGSSARGGLHPDSDLDFFGVLRRGLTGDEKRRILHGLVPFSARDQRPAAWRPVELTLVVQDEIRPWRYPPRLEFQYGEWLRDELLAGNRTPWRPTSPDLAVLITMVRDAGVTVRGPAPVELLDPVPRADLVRAILDELPILLDDLEADTRNVLLTLARMWITVVTGEVASKHAAASWAIERLPERHRPMLAQARAGYVGALDDRWDDQPSVRALAATMAERIRAEANGPDSVAPASGSG